jgi:hypothetical protein
MTVGNGRRRSRHPRRGWAVCSRHTVWARPDPRNVSELVVASGVVRPPLHDMRAGVRLTPRLSGSAGTDGGPRPGSRTPMMNSFNHFALSSVGGWLCGYVAGLRADAPGFAHLSIEPQLDRTLGHARAVYESIRGEIATEWRLDDVLLELTADLPANVSATPSTPKTPAGSSPCRSRPPCEPASLRACGVGLAAPNGTCRRASRLFRDRVRLVRVAPGIRRHFGRSTPPAAAKASRRSLAGPKAPAQPDLILPSRDAPQRVHAGVHVVTGSPRPSGWRRFASCRRHPTWSERNRPATDSRHPVSPLAGTRGSRSGS